MQGDGTCLNRHSVHFFRRKNARHVEVGSVATLRAFFHKEKQRNRSSGEETWITRDVFYIDPKGNKELESFSPFMVLGKKMQGLP